MNLSRIIYLFIVIITFASCKTNTVEDNSEHIYLKCIETALDCDKIGTPCDMLIFNHTLIINDYYYKHQLNYVDLTEMHQIKHFGLTGRGPFEINHTATIGVYPKSTNMFIFDDAPKKFIVYSIDSLKSGLYLGDKELMTNSDIPIFKAIVTDSNHFIATINDIDKRYGLFSFDGNLLRKFGDYPTSVENRIPKKANPLTFQFDMELKPNGGRFVAACYKSPIIEIYDINDTATTIIARHQYAFPIIKATITETFSSVASLPESVYGFMDISVSNKYIFALYSGRCPKDYNDTFRYSNTIYVYNWDGNHIQTINLDKDLVTIAYSSKDNCIYGFSENPEIKLYKISLPNHNYNEL